MELVPHPYNRTRPTIGVLAGWQFYWTATPFSYLSPVFHGICQAAHEIDCNVLLSCGMGASGDSNDPLRPAWPSLSPETDFVPVGPWNTDGLIVINPLNLEARSHYIQDVIADGQPVIFVGAGENGPTIMADNDTGILEAMQHLVAHGHQRIAFIAGSPEDLEGDTGERLRSYQFAVRAYGLATDPHLVVYGRHVYAGGYAAMQHILETGVTFSAVLASNDESALGAMQALKEAGRAIPHDVAIIGFDDRPESAVQEPALSSVHIPLFEMGHQALDSLVQSLEGRAALVEKVKVATHLAVRESCGCGRGAMAGGIAGSTALPSKSLDLAQSMAVAIVTEAQSLSAHQVQAACRRLVEAFEASLKQNDPASFQCALEDILRQTAADQDISIWQTAISILRNTLHTPGRPAMGNLAHHVLDQARLTINAVTQRRHCQYVVDQRWMLDRIGVLTTQLLTALDETQIYQILARHLPDMGIRTAAVALYEAEGEDAVAWSDLRIVAAPGRAPLRFRSREFPPDGLSPAGQSFSLALLPLASQRSLLGYVAFDTIHLELYGAIVQQLAGALNTAHLYRAATEGRRLAEEANRLKSRFLSTVSHELRTPLNLIVGLCGILLQASGQDAPPPEVYRKDIERIHANAQQLGWLIGDVLDLASSGAGQLRLTCEFVDLSQALRIVADSGRQLAFDKGLAWQESWPEAGPWVWGDRTRLRQVALNLVNNAVKFTTRGQVSLKLEASAGRVTVSVHDTGLGILPDEQPLVFDEFRRSERSIERGYGGLGLGLAICKRLIELHGGDIGLRSTGQEGDGCTFYFTLPAVQSPTSQASPPIASPPVEWSVLVFTSQSDSGERLCAHLNQRGFDARLALMDKACDWLLQLLASPPGVIALDMTTSPEQGWDTLKVIKSNPTLQDIPVLFYALSQDGGAVLELNYLTKPIEWTELERALNQHWPAADAIHMAKTILVVDDDPNTLDMHARIVQTHSLSHLVLQARNGREALEILQQEQVDLVLLDLMMPELDGFGVLEAMREREATRAIPVIVLTGQALTEKEMARLNQGVATVLGKGMFSLDETLAHIEAALERKHKLSSEAQRLVRRAMAYFHAHYADPISREDIARQVGLSEDYLTACFRQELGKTPMTYLNCYRINQAKQLLKNSQRSITDIAFSVGFSDSGYFSRLFRREVGLSPQAYRRT